jgi:hypothetical protein
VVVVVDPAGVGDGATAVVSVVVVFVTLSELPQPATEIALMSASVTIEAR